MELRLGNRVAGTVGALETGLAVDPGPAGGCGAADMVNLPGCVQQQLVEGVVVLGKLSAHPVALLGAERKGSAAGPDEDPGQVGHNTVPGPESHILLVPVVHRTPSEQNAQKKDHALDHTYKHQDWQKMSHLNWKLLFFF